MLHALHTGADITSADFMPHGTCFLWLPELLALHVTADAAIGLAYFSIPLALLSFVRRRRDLEFSRMFLLFGLFILACGTTHFLAVWTLWQPDFWLDGSIKAVTALASVGTAIQVWRVMPRALALPGRGELEAANAALAREVAERGRAEAEARRLNVTLEARVRERTAELEAANGRLRAALDDRELLLQELHHRVKNNLQVISSLMGLQARAADPAAAAPLRESLGRVRTIARVYDQLHRAGPGAATARAFDLREYLDRLARDLPGVYGPAAERVLCRVEGAVVSVDADAAAPLALIVNEILADTLRHAPPEGDGRPGTLAIRLDCSGSGAGLRIAGDGVGEPDAGAGAVPAAALGSELVRLLARQLGGTAELARGAGRVAFSLTLPAAAA